MKDEIRVLTYVDPVGIYYRNQDANERPAWIVERSEARHMKKAKRGSFICGNKFRLIAPAPLAGSDESHEEARGNSDSLHPDGGIRRWPHKQRLGVMDNYVGHTFDARSDKTHRPTRAQKAARQIIASGYRYEMYESKPASAAAMPRNSQ